MAGNVSVRGYELGTRIGEALVGDMPELAHIDIAIGQVGGPFETAFLTALYPANRSYGFVSDTCTELCGKTRHPHGKQGYYQG